MLIQWPPVWSSTFILPEMRSYKFFINENSISPNTFSLTVPLIPDHCFFPILMPLFLNVLHTGLVCLDVFIVAFKCSSSSFVEGTSSVVTIIYSSASSSSSLFSKRPQLMFLTCWCLSFEDTFSLVL